MDGGGSGMGQELPPTTGHLDMMESGSLWWMHPPALLSVPSGLFPTKPLTNRWSTLPKKNKFQYLAGAALEPAGGSYVYQIPAVAMPYIMTSNSKPANIENTRKYFLFRISAQMVADATGVSYDSLIKRKL